VDWAKSGTKRSLLSDGRGAPLSVIVAGANALDKMLAMEMLDSIPVKRPARVINRLHHLSVDAGYNCDDVIAGVLEQDHILRLRPPASATLAAPAEKKYPAQRWVVERTHLGITGSAGYWYVGKRSLTITMR
jgi:putative transposase